ncbi:MAG TPA: T9SS type A sorting domain-containing protein [Chitinophagaceae bacterium]|nr:T9SS type A sorting domain-containing protein [Chitinophagaceae bacterium]
MKKTILVLAMYCGIGAAQGQNNPQQVINSTGGSFTNNQYQADWSIGELALVNTMQAGNLKGNYLLSNGFLQPFAAYFKKPGNKFGSDEIRILPNPVVDVVEIDFETALPGDVVFSICDAAGHTLYTKSFTSTGNLHVEKFAMGRLANGLYLLQVRLKSLADDTQETRGSYKIIKLQ